MLKKIMNKKLEISKKNIMKSLFEFSNAEKNLRFFFRRLKMQITGFVIYFFRNFQFFDNEFFNISRLTYKSEPFFGNNY